MHETQVRLHEKPALGLCSQDRVITAAYSTFWLINFRSSLFSNAHRPSTQISSLHADQLRAVLIILGIWVIALLATLPLLFIAKQSSANYLGKLAVQAGTVSKI